jgi:hypothetical protein
MRSSSLRQGRGFSVLVGNEHLHERFVELRAVPRSVHPVLDRLALSRCRGVSPSRLLLQPVQAPLGKESLHQRAHGVLQRPASGDDDADRDRSVRVQALEVLEIPIKKRILVVSLDFGRDTRAVFVSPHVIDLMRLAFPWYVVDALLDNEVGVSFKTVPRTP